MAGLQGIPDLAGLSDLPFYLNQAGMQQINDAQAFNRTGLQQNQADLAGTLQKNQFDVQNDPLRLEQSRLANEGKVFENMKTGVEARTAVALEPEQREAKRKELLQKASEADLNKLLSDAQQDLLSADPNIQARGQKKMDASWGEISRRNKHKDEMEKTNAEIAGRANVAGIQAGASKYGADRQLEAARLRGNKGIDPNAPIWQRFSSAKSYDQQVGVLTSGIAEASAAGNLEEATLLQNYLTALQTNKINQAQAGARVNQENKPALANLGVPTLGNTTPSPVPAGGGAAPKPAAPAAAWEQGQDADRIKRARANGWSDDQIQAQLKKEGKLK